MLRIGDFFSDVEGNDYEVVSELGRGGMGVVFMVQELEGQRRKFVAKCPLSGTSLECKKISNEFNIEALLGMQISHLSGGELQKVLIARSLIENPNLLILDEPTQNLDVSGQLSFYKFLDQIFNDRKLSILMVSHDLHMVMSSTKKVICLSNHICCSGEPLAITKDPEFISLFGEDFAEMMSVYKHDFDHKHEGHSHV